MLSATGFHVNDMISHNLVGALGWWWVGKIRGRRTLRAQDTKNFDKLVPVLKHLDPYITKAFGGVSLIAFASPRTERTTIVEVSHALDSEGDSDDVMEPEISEGRLDA